MCTSAIDSRNKAALRSAVGNLCGALAAAFFGAVYEHFSFGVYSYFMLYAFAAPLITGLLLLILGMTNRPPRRLSLNLINSASATFAVGCAAAGVVEIYGTENKFLKVYFIVGALLAVIAAAAYIKENSVKQKAVQ